MRTSLSLSLPAAEVVLDLSAATDQGLVRLVNEDSYIAEPPLFVVADGMGGHARGDLASQTTVETLRKLLVGGDLPTASRVLRAIGVANDAVVALSSDRSAGGLSGTTLTGVALVVAEVSQSAHWMAFNIGDSRVYTWDGRRLEQLSVDHSAVQELVDAGLITEDAARIHPDRNIITRALGARTDVDADVWLLPLSSISSFLVCSDGLTKELDDDEIADILASHDTIDDSGVADALVAAAREAGGRDNITAVFVELASVDGLVVTTSTNTRDSGVLEDTTPRI